MFTLTSNWWMLKKLTTRHFRHILKMITTKRKLNEGILHIIIASKSVSGGFVVHQKWHAASALSKVNNHLFCLVDIDKETVILASALVLSHFITALSSAKVMIWLDRRVAPQSWVSSVCDGGSSDCLRPVDLKVKDPYMPGGECVTVCAPPRYLGARISC